MHILAVDTSAVTASCALRGDGGLLGAFELRCGLTHSQTVLPMAEDLVKNCRLSLSDVDLLAVNVGPGSFTGVRIGVAAVKGLSFTHDIPCAAVSTLESMAYPLVGLPLPGVICAVMDARREQVYTALFQAEGDAVRRLTPDEALPLDMLRERLEERREPVLLVGDGAAMCYQAFRSSAIPLYLAPETLRYQHAAGVAAAAEKALKAGRTCSAEQLQPIYLRLPQAERELRAKQAASAAADGRSME